MATGKFTHTIAQIDSAIDSINGIAQRLGVAAIVPLTRAQYDAITEKSATTLYIVYGTAGFTMYYGALPLEASGGGGGGDGGVAGRAVGLMHGTANCVAGQAIY